MPKRNYWPPKKMRKRLPPFDTLADVVADGTLTPLDVKVWAVLLALGRMWKMHYLKLYHFDLVDEVRTSSWSLRRSCKRLAGRGYLYIRRCPGSLNLHYLLIPKPDDAITDQVLDGTLEQDWPSDLPDPSVLPIVLEMATQPSDNEEDDDTWSPNWSATQWVSYEGTSRRSISLSPLDVRVWLFLWLTAATRGKAFVDCLEDELAQAVHTSVRNVQRAIQRLQKRGYLRVRWRHRRGRPNRYYLIAEWED